MYPESKHCHLLHYAKKPAIRDVKKQDEIKLLMLRTKLDRSVIKTICSHHEEVLLKRFSQNQTKCCNPFKAHKGVRKGKQISPLSLKIYETLIDPPDVVVPGVKLCVTCRIELNKKKRSSCDIATSSHVEAEDMDNDDDDDAGTHVEEPDDTESTNAMDSLEKDTSVVDVNSALANLDLTPLKTGQLAPSSRKTKGKQKLKSAKKKLKRKLEVSLDVDLDDSSESDKEMKSKEVNDLKKHRAVLQELKEKFNNSNSYAERVQILTLSPFGIARTMKEFGATQYMVRKSREVKAKRGILGQSNKRRGKALSEELKAEVVAFYELDENSRMCPGMKDTVKDLDKDGETVKHQKRLVLSNLKELHAAWKETHPTKNVGFSTFASLRPKWCVLAGASGTHSVCVCKYHQNPKLMVEAANLKSDLHELMRYCVCSDETESCMMGQCKECPRRQGIIDYLNDELSDVEEITYKQWVSTDRAKLTTIVESKEEFVENLATQVDKLTRHSFTAKAQSSYMKTLKASMTPEELLLQGDFAENFSYVVQDEIQSFHWENKQATLHPFVAYHLKDDGNLEHRNICVISDCKEHNTVTVHAFQKVVIQYLKVEFPAIKKIHYFTDGCAGQYKNRYSFINLCHHIEDFGLNAEWNFFATSHGKSACDGIGGTVKRLVTKASLQRPYDKQILTCDAMMEFCVQNIPGIQFFNVTPEVISHTETMLKNRFELAQTVKGTQQFHRYVPISTSMLQVYRLSNQSSPPDAVPISSRNPQVEPPVQLEIAEQNFVCCLYDGSPWIGMVDEISEEFGDFHINFMHPRGPTKQFSWPSKVDHCWVAEEDILCIINTPSLTSSSSRKYRISDDDVARISIAYPKWISDDQ